MATLPDDTPSPCQHACGFKDGHCRKCFRTPEEVQAWRTLAPREKQEVLARVALRRAQVEHR